MNDADSTRALALLVTRNFPPLLGGMEKVNQHLLESLQPAWRTALCGPAGCASYAPAQTEVKQSRIKPLPIFLLVTLWHAIRLSRRRQPQWVLAGSGLTAPIAWLAARCSGGKAVVYLHGLDVIVPSRIYQWLWLPFIRRCDMALVNSANTAKLALSRGVRSGRVHILHPGTDLPVLETKSALAFRRQFELGQGPLLLSVGRLTQRKGLAEFVEKALPAILKRHPETLLVIIGEDAVDALRSRAGSERERILVAAQRAGTGQSLRFLGHCDDATLGAAYQACDVHIFPVLALPGDVEGFGMVALEAAAHGLPTVAFEVGGVPDSVEQGCTGSLVSYGDYEALGAAVIRQIDQPHNQAVIDACRQFAAGKVWPVFAQRLRDLLSVWHGSRETI
ncbi:MAG: glycosyltransferase family 4 protein [Gammaproteobacteria bacterium]